MAGLIEEVSVLARGEELLDAILQGQPVHWSQREGDELAALLTLIRKIRFDKVRLHEDHKRRAQKRRQASSIRSTK